MSGLSLPPINVPALLRQYDLRPSKGLGQNFLQDNHSLQKIVRAAGLVPGDAVLEVGPGLGGLTRYLALSAQSVTAVELDRALFPALQAVLAPYENVRLVEGDILKLDPSALMSSPGYIVVANIPYYITSAVIRHLLECQPRPRRIVLTIQKEVAERICAGPGRMSLLALSVQVYGSPEIVAQIPAEAFYPAPKVDSAVLRVEIFPEPVIPAAHLEGFFSLIKAGFSQKRKTLRNSLSGGLHLEPTEAQELLERAGIDPRRRAETLNLDEWGKLTEHYKK
ncbi:MAG TPA: 16S rRNA (adenine(1518)-N(6)/adenine(1519)-N(6))-dimethyltransferase RsmA [Anaerolineales bacterium]|nr:16S rRNA (adenine(1518)-N(6)/adenine(1519)-N(6))-dimethyltransferase RsmA [Anaerolineales bacterium]